MDIFDNQLRLETRLSMRSFKHLVFLQELELDGDVTAQSLVFVLVDLILLLRCIDTCHGHGVPWPQVQFF